MVPRLHNFAKKNCQAKLVMTMWIIKLKSNLNNCHCQCDSFSSCPSCNHVWLPCLLVAVHVQCLVDSSFWCVCFWDTTMNERQTFYHHPNMFYIYIDHHALKRGHVQWMLLSSSFLASSTKKNFVRQTLRA